MSARGGRTDPKLCVDIRECGLQNLGIKLEGGETVYTMPAAVLEKSTCEGKYCDKPIKHANSEYGSFITVVSMKEG
jgi:hypothetical protein